MHQPGYCIDDDHRRPAGRRRPVPPVPAPTTIADVVAGGIAAADDETLRARAQIHMSALHAFTGMMRIIIIMIIITTPVSFGRMREVRQNHDHQPFSEHECIDL